MYVEYMLHILKVFVNVLLHYCKSLNGLFLEWPEGVEKGNKGWKRIFTAQQASCQICGHILKITLFILELSPTAELSLCYHIINKKQNLKLWLGSSWKWTLNLVWIQKKGMFRPISSLVKGGRSFSPSSWTEILKFCGFRTWL